jgi:hypothetical protein
MLVKLTEGEIVVVKGVPGLITMDRVKLSRELNLLKIDPKVQDKIKYFMSL